MIIMIKNYISFSLTLWIILGNSHVIAQDEGLGEHNKANIHMHRSSIDELVNAFDSPSRSEWQQPDKVISLFGDLHEKKIVDLGAGSGYFTLRLAAKGAHVIAADVNDDFQEIIKEKLNSEELKTLSPSIELRKVPYDDPDLEENEADGILVVNTWHHIDNRKDYMNKVLIGIREGGRIIIVDFKLGVPGGPPDSHRLGLEKALEEIRDLDFQEIQVDTSMLERQYVIIGIK